MLLERLEAILNRNVAESRRAQALARQLDGRVMSLTVEGTPLAFFFRAYDGRLAITARHDGPADASLSGTPISLLSLAGPRAGRMRCAALGRQSTGLARLADDRRDRIPHANPWASHVCSVAHGPIMITVKTRRFHGKSPRVKLSIHIHDCFCCDGQAIEYS